MLESRSVLRALQLHMAGCIRRANSFGWEFVVLLILEVKIKGKAKLKLLAAGLI